MDVIAVAVGSGGACAAIAQTVCAYLTQSRVDISITVRAPDGREVKVDVDRARDPLTVIRAVDQLLTPTQD
jgi:cobalamin biosynthesis protein CbiD